MSIKNALASVPVKDMKSAARWYETLFGRSAESATLMSRRPISKDAVLMPANERQVIWSRL
jgi:hypothetical protein